ncbi:50S ribosomal protein L24 [Lewinellaceae bacterium SD302]|nr:50S ribosomal protein L24 [Lewinellaceae bacterium SD302]
MANKQYKDQQKRFAPKLKIKKGDRVIVIAGAQKSRTEIREVIEVFPKENRAIVEGINIRKKHQKPTETSQGGIVEKPSPIHISNLMLVDGNDQPTRVGRQRNEDGKLVRISKKTGNTL